jgi:hypothetical protein
LQHPGIVQAYEVSERRNSGQNVKLNVKLNVPPD